MEFRLGLMIVIFTIASLLIIQNAGITGEYATFHVERVLENTDSELSSTLHLNSDLMKNKYLRNSTERVYTLVDIHAMIHIVSSRQILKLNEAVTTIVNLKLIHKLQFPELNAVYDGCWNKDISAGVAMNLSVIKDFSGYESVDDLREPYTPVCLTTETDDAKPRGKCTPEQCRFYMHCVLHQRTCTTQLLQIAANHLLNKNTFQLMSDDIEVDADVAMAMTMSQFAEPDLAIDYINNSTEKHGEQRGLLQARVLANARKGLDAHTIPLVVRDVTNALATSPTDEQCLYRKATVLVSLAHFFEAMEVLEIATTLYPHNPEFFEMKGSCNFQFQVIVDLLQAEKSFRRALELGVENEQETMQKLGMVLYRQGKLANAVTVYKDLARLVPGDINAILSIAHCYRQQGEGRKALNFANKAVKISENGKVSLLFRGSLYHYMGKERTAIRDLEACLKVHASHDLCLFNAGLVESSLGRFYTAIKYMVQVNNGIDISQTKMLANSHYVKSVHLINYFRYLYWKLDSRLPLIDLDKDFTGSFKDAWAKIVLQPSEEYFYSEQKGLSPGMREVKLRNLTDYPPSVQRLICKARKYGRYMQVKADSFLPNHRFNLAMGLSAIHVGQKLNKIWMSNKKADKGRLTWRKLYEMVLPYRRLADLETPVLWLGLINEEQHLGYHNEVSFYRGQVKNHRMKSYFDLVFELTKSMIKEQMSLHQTDRSNEVNHATTPEDLVKMAKNIIPTQITTSVPSIINKKKQYEGGMIVLGQTAFGASLYMNIPTTHAKTNQYNQELSTLINRLTTAASRMNPNSTRNYDVNETEDLMMMITYFFFNLCPFSRGSASVGFAALFGMFLSIDREVTSCLPAGKMLDMEATLCGGADAFITGTKHFFKLDKLDDAITMLPSVEETFPTVRTLLEVLTIEEFFDCDD